MSTKAKLAKVAGKFTRWALTTFTHGGSSLPGKVALKIDENVLKELSNDYEVIIVSGTNGKTLTTSLIVQILKQKYPNILTNPTGANLQQGIVSTFLGHKVKKGEKKIAVLEIDEATIKHITKFIQPKLFVFTNVFRDQMDRFGEIYTTYNLMLEGVKDAPEAIVLANGDLPIFNSVEIPNKQQFYGFNFEEDCEQMAHYNTDGILCPHCHNILHYKSITYSNLGKYYCPNGDFKRPELDYQVTELTNLSLTGSSFKIDGNPLSIPNAGLYNVYNALAAYSTARIFGLTPAEIQTGFESSKKIFGRQETFMLGNKKVMINLIKNPVGFNQIVQLLNYETEPFSLAILLNDNYADGQDISWIWDSNFEGLHDLDYREVLLGGLRVNDLQLRMEVAGFEKENKIIQSNEELIQKLTDTNAEKINILATYTALLDLRKELAKAGYIKEGMQS
ncbi:UDP-N-acetylmuramoyl-L-alanyl-D-glutamate--2,6-diaminopimelate ligase [Granulicatella balaenopterae]|uniref:Lipid II isoglutaminyl synthase (glutamine-hydrolyzing) subunit MurT n=1 Tax=Granulicatella balaenopterae TaxID=137733 RepID=A0A1H9H661_9LACT|nr:Mur ligase family protein [Granulicatella balaenopterae]SEQ57832.1 UDP-N-acetylmuramoyl-L-alanyl-D-glutamate--2,6-diaminopimelate ligase [Granulicatella balaenopterae]